jgi:competence protein ComEA
MVRPSRAAEFEDRVAVRQRLTALGLSREPAAGWVPESAGEPVVAPRVDPPVAPGVPSIATAVPPVAAVAPPSLGELARAWVIDRLPPWTHGAVERVSLGAIALAMAGLVAAVVIGVVMVHHGASPGYSSSYDTSGDGAATSSSSAAAAAPSAPAAGADATSIVVDVGGRVRKPGLVTLPAGARVADAIAAAGGPLRHKEIATIDLAARVTDGQLLLVGVKDVPAAAGASADGSSSDAPAAPVSLSTATSEELETLPGVGPVTAQKIIDFRTAHSGFTSVSQLQQVSGIGPARYAELSPLVTP